MALQPFFNDSSVTTRCSTTVQPTVKTSLLPRIELVQNDTGPQMLMTLRDTHSGDTLDLSRLGTEIQFNFSAGPSEPVKAVIPMFPGPDAINGQVMLDWSAGTPNVMNTVGDYYGEVQITWPDGRIQTTPSKLKFRIRKELE
jgi:hypothetical protein